MLRSAGIKVILKQCRNPEEYREWVMIAGKELKCEAEAQKENDRIEQELAELRREKHSAAGKTILCLIWDNPPTAAGQGSLPDTVIRLAGQRNIAGGIRQDYFNPSFEWLLKINRIFFFCPVSQRSRWKISKRACRGPNSKRCGKIKSSPISIPTSFCVRGRA